jgi:hypothetical protein
MTFLAWNLTVTRRSTAQPPRTSVRVRVRHAVRRITHVFFDNLYRVPSNSYLEKISACGFLFLLLGKLLFFLLSPANVSIHALAGVVASSSVSALLHFWSLRNESLELRTAATFAALCSWTMIIVNLLMAYTPHLYVPHFDTTAARLAIEYAVPLASVMWGMCALQILVLARDQVSVPYMPLEVAFACFVLDCYERVLRIPSSMKIEAVKYIMACHNEWKER